MELINQNEVQLRVPGYFDKNNRRLGAGITIEREIFGPEYDNLEKIAEVQGVPVKELFDFRSELLDIHPEMDREK